MREVKVDDILQKAVNRTNLASTRPPARPKYIGEILFIEKILYCLKQEEEKNVLFSKALMSV